MINTKKNLTKKLIEAPIHMKWGLFIIASLALHLVWVFALQTAKFGAPETSHTAISVRVIESGGQPPASLKTKTKGAQSEPKAIKTDDLATNRTQTDGSKADFTDLSADAKLISVKFPEYTPQAIDANLQGHFAVKVYVGKKGEVLKASLNERVGFGMDRRLLSCARNARFLPQKNPLGGAVEGWTEIKFRLQIP